MFFTKISKTTVPIEFGVDPFVFFAFFITEVYFRSEKLKNRFSNVIWATFSLKYDREMSLHDGNHICQKKKEKCEGKTTLTEFQRYAKKARKKYSVVDFDTHIYGYEFVRERFLKMYILYF